MKTASRPTTSTSKLSSVPEDKDVVVVEESSTKKNAVTVLPQWHGSLEVATIDAVSQLQQYNHGWLCTILSNDVIKDSPSPYGVLAILDITTRVNGEASPPRYMNIGPLTLNPASHDGSIEIVKALLSTMYHPNAGNNVKPPKGSPAYDYYIPRRPTWILIDDKPLLRDSTALIATLLQTVNVVVKLNSSATLKPNDPTKVATTSESTTTSSTVFNGKRATWDAGYELAFDLDNIKVLPQQNPNEIWKCTMTMIQDSDDDSSLKECFLVIEDITNGVDEENSFAVGVGPCPAITVNPDGMIHAILATMLCPRRSSSSNSKEGGNNTKKEAHDDDGGNGTVVEPRRPGRIILDKALEPWLEYIQSKLNDIDVTVEV